MTDAIGSYLKKHSDALVKDVGVEAAAAASGRSKATLGRYYSLDAEHAERFMPIDVVARLEKAASYPHVTSALAELAGLEISLDPRPGNTLRKGGGMTSDVVALSQRFAALMAEYHQSIEDGKITINEARRLLSETQMLQRVLLELKLHLEEETMRP